MTRFMPLTAVAALALAGACSQLSTGADGASEVPAVAPAPAPASVPEPEPTPEPAPDEAEVADPEPATNEAEATAPAPQGGAQRLGEVTASLGDPSVPGTWLATSLVSSAQPGRVEIASSGQSAEVELRPATGAATLSPSAMQALGIGLTDIPTVIVYTR